MELVELLVCSGRCSSSSVRVKSVIGQGLLSPNNPKLMQPTTQKKNLKIDTGEFTAACMPETWAMGQQCDGLWLIYIMEALGFGQLRG